RARRRVDVLNQTRGGEAGGAPAAIHVAHAQLALGQSDRAGAEAARGVVGPVMMAVTVVRPVMPAVGAAPRGWYEGEVGAGGEVQRGARVRPHLTVNQQPMAGLE